MSRIQALLSLSLHELRSSRLEELFTAIDTASSDDATLITSLVERVFEGEAGLAALREPHVQHALAQRALVHAEPSVRCFTLVICRQLSASPGDVRILCESGVMPIVADLIVDQSLAVAEKASQLIVACAQDLATLRVVFDHRPTLERLLSSATKTSTGKLSTPALRSLALFAEVASVGEEQFLMCEACGALAPVLTAWNSADELVQLNALEIFSILARRRRGFEWLRTHGVLDGLLAIARGGGATGDELMVTLQLPSVLHCLAELLEHNDRDEDALLVLGADGAFLQAVWPRIEPSAGHADGARDASMSLIRAVACSQAGLLHVLTHVAQEGEHHCLHKQLRSSEERAKVCAIGVLAQLCSSSARFYANSAVLAAQQSLRSLLSAVSASGTTTPGDTLAGYAVLPSPELRVAALRLMRALAQLDWGAVHLARCEAVLEYLIHTGSVTLSPDELREKHALAGALVDSPLVIEAVGAGSAVMRHMRGYVTAGPFANLPRSEPKVMEPMTL